ncbi:DsbA family protein [Streptomyces sp. NPDC014744]|uniref:DsbA family protein n=1 Tax=Streptomyces sp. NPDC014744 TaxID=3364903 RepID=UPI0036F6A757
MIVEVWSDVVCPWCYLGKRRLDRAVRRWQEQGGEPLTVVLRPFQLAPGAPLESRPLTAEQPASIEASVQHTPETTSGCLTEIARDHGPDFTWRPAWSPNTFQAHRLLSLALEQGGPDLQWQLSEQLFRAHFGAGEDLGDRSVLAAVAERAGVSGAADFLAGGRLTGAVRSALTEGVVSGVRTAPTFVVRGRALAGAQSVRALLDHFGAAAEAADAEGDEGVRRYRLARAMLDVGDPLSAADTLRPLLNDRQVPADVRLLAARAYFASAQLESAKRELEVFLDAQPTDDFAHFLLGRTFERLGQDGAALRAYRLACALGTAPQYRTAVDRLAGAVP